MFEVQSLCIYLVDNNQPPPKKKKDAKQAELFKKQTNRSTTERNFDGKGQFHGLEGKTDSIMEGP